MTWAGFIRIAAFVALVAIFVFDYGFGLFAKEIGTEIYAFIAALALGVDAKWLLSRVRGISDVLDRLSDQDKGGRS